MEEMPVGFDERDSDPQDVLLCTECGGRECEDCNGTGLESVRVHRLAAVLAEDEADDARNLN